MAGPKPQDEYNPVPEVTPSLNVADNTLSVRAQPSQSGNALAGMGKDISGAGQEVFNTALQIQGLANEHAANAAEMQLAVQGGQLYDEYKSKTGLDAANAKDAYVKNYLALNEKIRGSLGAPQAQKAYDSLATRRMSFTIQDMNSYAADQTKKAYMTGNNAAMNLAIDETSKYEVANDPAQFGDRIGNIVFQTNAMFTAPQYGRYQDISASTNKDGTLKFDTATDEGRIAQADYDQYLQEATGRAYSNAIKTIADDPQHGDIDKAVKLLDQSKDKMPASTYAKMSTELSARYRNEQTRDVATEAINDVNRTYRQTAGITDSGSLVSVFHAQESGNGATSTNLGQIQPETWKQYAKEGENIDNPKDNEAVTKRILDDLSSKYGGDISRIAVGYFSGPGNVAPAGSSTPWVNDFKDKNGKSVSSYVEDIKGRTGGAGIGQNGYISQANYVRLNWDTITEQTRSKAESLHPHDSTFADQAVSRVQQRMSDIIRTQEYANRVDQDTVLTAIRGSDKVPALTNMDQLDNSTDPAVKQAWQNYQLNNPFGAQRVQNLITANSRGKEATYGTDFARHFLDRLGGKTTDDDVLSYVGGGKNAAVTNTGYNALTQHTKDLGTPQGQAFAQSEKKFFEDAQGLITGTSLYPGLDGGERQAVFEKFIMEKIPQIDAAKAAGKNASEIFGDPKSPDYIGKDMAHYVPKDGELDAMINKGYMLEMAKNNAGPTKYASLADLQKAVSDKKIGPADARKYIQDNGLIGKWVRDVPPQIPASAFPSEGQ